MATHASAEKRHRQSLKRRARNRSAKSTIKTSLKTALTALEKGDRDDALTAAKKAASQLDKAVSRGILHKKNASRRISRLYQKLA